MRKAITALVREKTIALESRSVLKKPVRHQNLSLILGVHGAP